MRKLSLKRGFTLVELIAVVAVIAILVGIVVPRIGDLRGRASQAKTDANKEIVQGAYERAKMDFNDTVAATFNGTFASPQALVDALVTNGYLNKSVDASGWTMSGAATTYLVK